MQKNSLVSLTDHLKVLKANTLKAKTVTETITKGKLNFYSLVNSLKQMYQRKIQVSYVKLLINLKDILLVQVQISTYLATTKLRIRMRMSQFEKYDILQTTVSPFNEVIKVPFHLEFILFLNSKIELNHHRLLLLLLLLPS